MANFSKDDAVREYLKQKELLTQAYETFDQKTPTPIRIAALAQDEEDFVNQGLIPYLQSILEDASASLRIPVSISVEYESGKASMIKASVKPKNSVPATPKEPFCPVVPLTPTPSKPAPEPKRSVGYNPQIASKAPPTGLRVNIGNGLVIHEFYAADTFAQAIAYAFEKVGVEKVINTVNKYDMILDGEPLVKRGTYRSPMANSHEVAMGYYTNTHSNNATKKRLLDRLFGIIGLHCSVVILEKRT